ncbi:MAG: DUF58 domain-containing protein [Myxococcota bacterium]
MAGLLGQARPRKRDDLFDESFMARLQYLEIVARRTFRGQSRGERRSKRLGAGLEFADHRRYSPGDDFRHIDWNVYNRLGKLLLRLYEEEEDLTVYVLVDTSASMAVGDGAKLDQARRLAAALAYITLANLDRVSIVAFSEAMGPRFLPARGKAQIFHAFDFLAGLEASGTTRMQDAFKAFVHQAPRRGVAVVLSDLYAQDGHEAGINVLRYHKFEPLVLHLVDERELNPDLRGDLQLVDAETGQVREITVTPRLLERYRKAHAAWRQEIEGFCKERQVGYFAAPVQTPFEDLILRLMRAGGFIL